MNEWHYHNACRAKASHFALGRVRRWIVLQLEGFHVREIGLLMVGALAASSSGWVVARGNAQDAGLSAVQRVLDQMPQCQNLGDYYWEIGNGQGVLLHGQQGKSIGPDTDLSIASASKWVFAAYVLQRVGPELEPAQVQKLQMTSGYDELNPARCIGKVTAGACFDAAGNDRLDTSHVGLFSYNGGHMQKLMMDLGLGDLSLEALTADLHHYLPLDAAFSYGTPQAAAGLRTTSAAYGAFLRRILRGELAMAHALGSKPTCTMPTRCATAVSSPAPFAWHYSLGHWVEDDLQGDGAFSSAGAFGFYPWISADRGYYGLFVRLNFRPESYKESVYCGIPVRHAFMGSKK